MYKRMILTDNLSDFSETAWHSILTEARKAGRMTTKEFHLIKQAPITKILTALPYFAGCPNPDQIAVLRIVDLLCGIRSKTFFKHRANQSIRNRLLPGICFPDGDPAVIEVALTLCELISLNDHFHDQELDRNNGVKNPINSRIVSFYTNQKTLLNKLNQNQEIFKLFQSLFKTNLLFINAWIG